MRLPLMPQWPTTSLPFSGALRTHLHLPIPFRNDIGKGVNFMAWRILLMGSFETKAEELMFLRERVAKLGFDVVKSNGPGSA